MASSSSEESLSPAAKRAKADSNSDDCQKMLIADDQLTCSLFEDLNVQTTEMLLLWAKVRALAGQTIEGGRQISSRMSDLTDDIENYKNLINALCSKLDQVKQNMTALAEKSPEALKPSAINISEVTIALDKARRGRNLQRARMRHLEDSLDLEIQMVRQKSDLTCPDPKENVAILQKVLRHFREKVDSYNRRIERLQWDFDNAERVVMAPVESNVLHDINFVQTTISAAYYGCRWFLEDFARQFKELHETSRHYLENCRTDLRMSSTSFLLRHFEQCYAARTESSTSASSESSPFLIPSSPSPNYKTSFERQSWSPKSNFVPSRTQTATKAMKSPTKLPLGVHLSKILKSKGIKPPAKGSLFQAFDSLSRTAHGCPLVKTRQGKVVVPADFNAEDKRLLIRMLNSYGYDVVVIEQDGSLRPPRPDEKVTPDRLDEHFCSNCSAKVLAATPLREPPTTDDDKPSTSTANTNS